MSASYCMVHQATKFLYPLVPKKSATENDYLTSFGSLQNEPSTARRSGRHGTTTKPKRCGPQKLSPSDSMDPERKQLLLRSRTPIRRRAIILASTGGLTRPCHPLTMIVNGNFWCDDEQNRGGKGPTHLRSAIVRIGILGAPRGPIGERGHVSLKAKESSAASPPPLQIDVKNAAFICG